MWRRGLALGMLALLLGQAGAPGRTRLQSAEAVAHWRWGTVCHGGPVTIFNRPLKPPLIAIATWDHGFTDCTVTYSTTYQWAWWSLCRATVHEWGHLSGHRHVRNPLAVMFPWTIEPWPPCGPDHNHPRLYRVRG